MRLASAEIDLNALRHNLARVRELAPNSKVMAVLKANAYGHGLVRIAKALPSADAFAVARIDEALALRQGGVVKPIVLLEGFFDKADLPIILANNFQTIVHDENQLAMLEAADLDGEIKVWLKVDTGMHRLGCYPAQFDEFYERLSKAKAVASDINLMTHFACADDLCDPKTTQQFSLFSKLAGNKPQLHCLANSAAIVGWQQTHGDWVRPGLMMYGVSPMLNQQGHEHQLKPVMSLTTKVIAIRSVKANETVGYGSAWRAAQDTFIGVVAMGYGDGYPRHAPNGTPVSINGVHYPLVGRVSMDMITVDLGPDCADGKVKIGDKVVMWGPELPVEVIAKHATTIPYELLCNITPRVDYQYTE